MKTSPDPWRSTSSTNDSSATHRSLFSCGFKPVPGQLAFSSAMVIRNEMETAILKPAVHRGATTEELGNSRE
jgi:hypothetical protein